MSEADKILEQEAKKEFTDFNLEEFKEKHTELYVVIRQAMASYAQVYIKRFSNELTK
jgi:hypothetical protein